MGETILELPQSTYIGTNPVAEDIKAISGIIPPTAVNDSDNANVAADSINLGGPSELG